MLPFEHENGFIQKIEEKIPFSEWKRDPEF